MYVSSLFLLVSSIISGCFGSAQVQGDCVAADHALGWLAKHLSCDAVISCLGSSLQQYNAARYWGLQYAKNASVVVFPANTQDVSLAVRATHMSSLGNNFAFVGGAHGQTNASSSFDFIIDLHYLNGTQLLANYAVDGHNITAVAYQGGATWIDVMSVTGGSGYTAVGARISSVGVGGFSTGGGIGFLAGAEGYAIDRLRAMEVVIPSGDVVLATKNNKYSDLFWALQGGGGQFGIVTTFYQEAAGEPRYAVANAYYVEDSVLPRAREHIVEFFEHNNDPFSLVYVVFGFFPADLSSSNPDPSTFAPRTLLVTLWLAAPGNQTQQTPTETFATLLEGLNGTAVLSYTLPYQDLSYALDPIFPYGYRRGFWGPQTTKISTAYLRDIQNEFNSYIENLLEAGEYPVTALWALQFMFPGLNGHLPSSDSSTAWPHAVAGHQTLFSPAWSSVSDDDVTYSVNQQLNDITYAHQKQVGPTIADYPNYISPDATGTRVWGANLDRLQKVKQKYDPKCRIHNGRVFASSGCLKAGFANIFAD